MGILFVSLGMLGLSGCSDRSPSASGNVAQLEPYAVHAKSSSQPQVLVAEHRPMNLSATFSAGRVAVRAPNEDANDDSAFELGATAWGCAGAMHELPSVEPVASETHPGGVEYRHADFDEWYLTGPAGLEQGFTVRRLPECAARGAALRIQLAFQTADGFSSVPSNIPNEALLRAPGNRLLHYGQARAEDASGGEYAVNVELGVKLALQLDATRAVLPLIVDPLAWVQQTKLTPTDGAAGAGFGFVVAFSGDTALIAAPGDNHGLGASAGAVYVFVRSGTAWSLQQKLVAQDGAAADTFGWAIALNGDTALIGAPGDDDSATNSGSAYLFQRSAGTWTQIKKLTASDAMANDRFGTAVALSNAVALVGAPFADNGVIADNGAAYTFQGPAWSAQTKLLPIGAPRDHSGAAVAISGARLALGCDRENGYVVSFYDFVNGAWTAALGGVSSTDPALAHYASALAMSANYTVVGAQLMDPPKVSTLGSVLVVSNANHTVQSTLKASDGALGDQFGNAVAISESDVILIGSPKDDDKGTDSGSAYVFGFANGWTQQQKLTASDGTQSDVFGWSVALSGGTALLGAPTYQTKAGAAYTESYGSTNGTACAQSSECGSGFCVEKVCCNSACNGTCQSCLQKNRGGNSGGDGTCGNVRSGTDPLDACPTDDGNTCQKSGLCDGKGACTLYALGTSCTLSECASATSATLNSACSGLGECKPTATVPCQLGYRCVSGVCKSGCHANSDCDATLGFVCAQTGDCKQPKGAACNADDNCSTGTCQWGHCCLANADGVCSKPLGIDCALGSECGSGTCSAGVCCNSECGGACESCALPASKGTCSATSGPACGQTGGSPGASGEAGQGAGPGLGQGGLGGTSGSGSGGDGNVTLGGSAGFEFGGSSGFEFGGSSGFGLNGGAGFGFAGSAGFEQGGLSADAGLGSGDGAEVAGGPSAHAGNGGNAGQSALSRAGHAGTGLADDQLSTACGCRAAGGRSTPSVFGLSLALLFTCARRRKRGAETAQRH
ncbi:MAG: FG-GAP repeat protein [Polyangiaceae bacterium]